MARPSAIWLATVRAILADLATSDVAEFELAQKNFRLRVRRDASTPLLVHSQEPEPIEPGGQPITAPFTGIFYRAPSPTAEPYVRDGDWVEAGTTIGLIETMKIFNEVKTEEDGRLERLLVASGQLVQAGERLAVLIPGKPPGGAGFDASE